MAKTKEPTGRSVTTSMTITAENLRLLRLVSLARQDDPQRDGRQSISSVIEELIERHRAELEREARAYTKK